MEPVPIGDTFYETVNFKEDRNMKVKIIIILTVIILLIGSTIGAKDKTPISPSALIGQTIYEFETVVDGAEVVHDFVIRNKGAATLEIQKVITG